MKASALIFLVLATTAFSQKHSGMYSRSATPIWDQLASMSGKAKPLSIPSPNGSILLVASYSDEGDTGVQLTLLRHEKRLWSEMVSPGVGIEAGWAPDSTAFFVTTSGGGRNGFYELVVYFVNQDAVSALDVTPAIEKAFGHPVKCQLEEPPNIAGLRWMPNSKELIAVAEIVHHSNCDSDGTFRAYRVSLPEGRIIENYDQIEAKRLFGGELGWEIRNAPDRCIRRPTSCWQYFNHDSIR
jgi:hypothetical protein